MNEQQVIKKIYAPEIVGIPPHDSARDMTFSADGSIRFYGTDCLDGKVEKVFTSSSDNGRTWKTYLTQPGDPGAMVKCPWADYWLKLGKDEEGRLCSWRSEKGPGYPAEKKVIPGKLSQELRPLLPLPHRKRWIAAVSNCARENNECYHAAVCFTDDDGETWTYVDVPEVPGVQRQFPCDKHPHWFNNGCEPTIAELADHTLLMALRTSGEYASFTRSADGGETWEVPRPVPGFWQANTMPELHKLPDGRLLFIWNNTAMLPTRDPAEAPELGPAEIDGTWERVFTNRDVLHAAISDDQGKTWQGFREILMNEIRNDSDFREAGTRPDQSLDKSVHQTQTLDLPDGTVLVSAGQNMSARKLVIFHPDWLYEKSREEDFRHGLSSIMHHLYVKSLNGSFRGWAGHCALNRIPGVVMAREPDQAENRENREDLWLCRIRDSRLLSTRSGFTWNFPAAQKGKLSIEFRSEGAGFQLALQDHWSNPSDEYLVPRSFAVFPVTPEFSGTGKWVKLEAEWDCTAGTVSFACGGKKVSCPLALQGFAPAGPSYLHIQTLAEEEDLKGTFFRKLSFAAE